MLARKESRQSLTQKLIPQTNTYGLTQQAPGIQHPIYVQEMYLCIHRVTTSSPETPSHPGSWSCFAWRLFLPSPLPTSEFLLFKMLSCNKSTFSKLGRNIPHLFSRLVCGRTNRAHFKLLELQDPQRKFPALIQQPVTKPLFLCK